MTRSQGTDLILLNGPPTVLARIAAQGKTLVIVLPELSLAAAFADHVVML